MDDPISSRPESRSADLVSPQPPAGLPLYVQTKEMQDVQHLKILSICYYVNAGLTFLGASIPVIHLVMGIFMMNGGMASSGLPTQELNALRMMGGFFVVISSVIIVIGWAVAVMNFLVARSIVRRQSRMLCMITAGINCLSIPVGTTLGVFTFIVLARPSVAESFSRNEER